MLRTKFLLSAIRARMVRIAVLLVVLLIGDAQQPRLLLGAVTDDGDRGDQAAITIVVEPGADAVQQPRAVLGLSTDNGQMNELETTVISVFPNSPAAAAGIELGDIFLALDGTPISQSRQLVQQVRAHKPGDAVKIRIRRQGEEKTLSAKLGKYPEGILAQQDPPRMPGGTLQLGGGVMAAVQLEGGNCIITGTPTVPGDFTERGVLDMRIQSREDYSSVNVGGNVELGGLLYVWFNGYEPRAGDAFELIRGAKSMSGKFDALKLPKLRDGLSWKLIYDDLEHKIDYNGDGKFDLTLVITDAEGKGERRPEPAKPDQPR